MERILETGRDPEFNTNRLLRLSYRDIAGNIFFFSIDDQTVLEMLE